jgi:hypothetical protein
MRLMCLGKKSSSSSSSSSKDKSSSSSSGGFNVTDTTTGKVTNYKSYDDAIAAANKIASDKGGSVEDRIKTDKKTGFVTENRNTADDFFQAQDDDDDSKPGMTTGSGANLLTDGMSLLPPDETFSDLNRVVDGQTVQERLDKEDKKSEDRKNTAASAVPAAPVAPVLDPFSSFNVAQYLIDTGAAVENPDGSLTNVTNGLRFDRNTLLELPALPPAPTAGPDDGTRGTATTGPGMTTGTPLDISGGILSVLPPAVVDDGTRGTTTSSPGMTTGTPLDISDGILSVLPPAVVDDGTRGTHHASGREIPRFWFHGGQTPRHPAGHLRRDFERAASASGAPRPLWCRTGAY